ncbi:MAG TPA: zf-HC2 domain-containing protein [Verrucomicrobiae bacterium]|jgi:anti-sigma factor RsiW|nr:zf-HC2 domain-containing protein [Verrucomicrobiae bacterium]
MRTSPPIDCTAARPLLLDYQRGRLTGPLHGEVHAHLDGCAACAREELAERALTEALERRLPQHAAPVGLKRRLAASHLASAGPTVTRPSPWRRAWIPALAAAVLLVVVALPRLAELPGTGRGSEGRVAAEAVNDHLRLLERGVSVASGGIHQVKPWFAGKLDFAPVVDFAGDAEFPLEGGAVEYFLDRKAAAFVYGRRLHHITLFVVRAEGLRWPAAPEAASRRGFNTLTWRQGELGYVLVSDVDAHDLTELAARLGSGGPAGGVQN